MNTIGLIGGMSWESTKEYYRIINQSVQKSLGKNNSAPMIIRSLNFEEIKQLQFQGESGWQTLNHKMTACAKELENCGAKAILICTNLMHKTAPFVRQAISVPIIHIAEETAREISQRNMSKTGLLGTVFTMKEDFYKEIFNNAGIEVFIPEASQIDRVNRIIYDELCRGIIKQESADFLLSAINSMIKNHNIDCVTLGCTELPLILTKAPVPLFDTTTIHAQAAARFVLGES